MLGTWLNDLATNIAARVPGLRDWTPTITWYLDPASRALAQCRHQRSINRVFIALNVGAFDQPVDQAPTGRTAEALRRVLVHELGHVLVVLEGRAGGQLHGDAFYSAACRLATAAHYPPPDRDHVRYWPIADCDGWRLPPPPPPLSLTASTRRVATTTLEPTTDRPRMPTTTPPPQVAAMPPRRVCWWAAGLLCWAEVRRRHTIAVKGAETRRQRRQGRTVAEVRADRRAMRRRNRAHWLAQLRRSDPGLNPSELVPVSPVERLVVLKGLILPPGLTDERRQLEREALRV